MYNKDLTSILGGPSLTPEQAYALADDVKRRSWFPQGRPGPSTKASPYELPPAQAAGPSHLTPALAARLAVHEHDHLGERYSAVRPCPHAHVVGPSELIDGKCARCKGTPAERAEQRRWQRQADLTTLHQQARAGQLGTGSVRVVDYRQAEREDSLKANLHAMVDGLY